MTLPLPNLDDRKLTMREQVIARLRQLNPDVMYREEYLNTLKDFALLQALEVAIQVHLDRTNEEMSAHMFNAGMDYERQRIAKELTETRRMEAGTLIASWSNK